MDFAKLLSLASQKQKNVNESNVAPKRYDTSIPPPKREPKKSKVQSSAVQAFLTKKEEEKKQKAVEERKKTAKCMQAYQDSMSKKHVKSADALKVSDEKKNKQLGTRLPTQQSKSVNNALEKSDGSYRFSTKLKRQSDKKDSGKIESSISSVKIPSRTHLNDKSTKIHEKEKSAAIVKPKATSQAKDPMLDSKSKEKKGFKKPASAKVPMSFDEILKLAKKKDKDSADGANSGKEKMSDRPMTQEEKDRMARKQTKEYQDWYNYGPSGAKKSSGIEDKAKSGPSNVERVKEKQSLKNNQPQKNSVSSNSKASLASNMSKAASGLKSKNVERPTLTSGSASSGGRTSNDLKKRQHNYDETRDSVLVCRPASDTKNSEPNLSAWDRIYNQMNKNRPVKRKPESPSYDDDYSDVEEEEEDDLDDFIDDDPLDEEVDRRKSSTGGNYSKYIREIFGYDKRKYRFEKEDDINNMETTFAGQMKEEAKSARLGRTEDIEDMKQEELMKKRKKMRR